MKVYLGVPRGFCAGVVRAIDIVELALKKYGSPIYVKHQIVHNPFVVASLEEKGVITVEDVQEIPHDATVVFSAHGSPPEDFQLAEERNLNVIDATCPLVTRVHNEAKKYSNEGRKLVLVGHRGHQEVKGTMGQSDMFLVDDREPFQVPDWDSKTPISVITQTTLSVEDTERSINNIEREFSDVVVRNDLCYATTNRQMAVKKIASMCDMFFVIGSKNSSNSLRLVEVAKKSGCKKSELFNFTKDLPLDQIVNSKVIGLTSGASAPEKLIQDFISEVGKHCDLSIEEVVTTKEKVVFKLPKALN